ncbi:MAG: Transposase DDE domain protein [Candidatus Methanofastidiosum methylothiophilum]|uniref:Transposase DDE domain protein n=2 Tax=Candidatus Methanofastidiosum methylothiophilum TaxID=1705564 RepID=A0A150IZK9_9EURY|nr:MAG: Transposase DDE domain protein [Candidatus Methanofastidiosum methylthiophilus]
MFYERRKNWLKVNIAIDENTGELLGIDIAPGPQHDSKSFEKIVQDVPMSVLKGDGAFDKKGIFNYCYRNKITPAIKVRKSSIPRSRSSPLRKKCVQELMGLGEEAWKEKYDYGKRWLVESYFSAVKRSYGESVKSRRSDMMVKEAMIKFLLYATVRQIA